MNSSKKDFIHMQRAKNVVLTGINDKPIPRSELIKWVNDLLGTKLTKVEQMCTGASYCLLLNQLFPGAVPIQKVKHPSNFVTHYINNFKVLQQSFQSLEVKAVVPIDDLIIGRFQANFAFLKWFKMFYETNCDPREHLALKQLQIEKEKYVKKNDNSDNEDIAEGEDSIADTRISMQYKQNKAALPIVRPKINKSHAVSGRNDNSRKVEPQNVAQRVKKVNLIGNRDGSIVKVLQKVNIKAPKKADYINTKKSIKVNTVETHYINAAQQTDPIKVNNSDALSSVQKQIAEVLNKLEKIKPQIAETKSEDAISAQEKKREILRMFDPLLNQNDYKSNEIWKMTPNVASQFGILETEKVPVLHKRRNYVINKAPFYEDLDGLFDTETINTNIKTIAKEQFHDEIYQDKYHELNAARCNRYKNNNRGCASIKIQKKFSDAAFETDPDIANIVTFPNLQNTNIDDDFYEMKYHSAVNYVPRELKTSSLHAVPFDMCKVVTINRSQENMRMPLPFIDFSRIKKTNTSDNQRDLNIRTTAQADSNLFRVQNINTLDNQKDFNIRTTALVDHLGVQKSDKLNKNSYDIRRKSIQNDTFKFIERDGIIHENDCCREKKSETLHKEGTKIMKAPKHFEAIGKNKLDTTRKHVDLSKINFANIPDCRKNTTIKAPESGCSSIINNEVHSTNKKSNGENVSLGEVLLSKPYGVEDVLNNKTRESDFKSINFNNRNECKYGRRTEELYTEDPINKKNNMKVKLNNRIENVSPTLQKVKSKESEGLNSAEIKPCSYKPNMKINLHINKVNNTDGLKKNSVNQKFLSPVDSAKLRKIKELNVKAKWCSELYQGIEFKRNLNYSRLYYIDQFLSEFPEKVDHNLRNRIQSILYATENAKVVPGMIPTT